VAVGVQLAQQITPDEAGGAGDEDLHDAGQLSAPPRPDKRRR
jgi:hypothetical protein